MHANFPLYIYRIFSHRFINESFVHAWKLWFILCMIILCYLELTLISMMFVRELASTEWIPIAVCINRQNLQYFTQLKIHLHVRPNQEKVSINRYFDKFWYSDIYSLWSSPLCSVHTCVWSLPTCSSIFICFYNQQLWLIKINHVTYFSQ